MSDTVSSKGMQPVQDATRQARTTLNQPFVQNMGRVGYVAKGVVYVLIGGLAALAGLGSPQGSVTDRKGALDKLYNEPFGKFLLIALGIGLACYMVWSLVQALADTENKGSDAKGIARRLFYAGVGISYGLLAWAALQLATGAGNGGKNSDANAQDWTAKLLQQPFGVALVVIAGLVVLGAAGWQFYRAYKADFQKHWQSGQMDAKLNQAAIWFGRFGLASRSVVFGIIGLFLVIAALQHNSQKVVGLGGALNQVAAQPYGQVLLVLVAVGFIAFGLFCWVEARYRRMLSPDRTADKSDKH